MHIGQWHAAGPQLCDIEGLQCRTWWWVYFMRTFATSLLPSTSRHSCPRHQTLRRCAQAVACVAEYEGVQLCFHWCQCCCLFTAGLARQLPIIES